MVISLWICEWIFDPSSRTSASFVSDWTSVLSRALTSGVSRSVCRSTVVKEGRVAAIRSIVRPASPAAATSGSRSSDRVGDSSTMRWKSVWAWRPSAWASTSSAAGTMSGTRSIRARRCGVVCVNSTTRNRSSPWTTRRIVPSDCFSIRWIVATVPIR